MYNLELKQNQILPIYTDYKEETQFEGFARLISKVSDNDSYFINNEKLEDETSLPIQSKYYKILTSIFKNLRNYLKQNITSASLFSLFCKEMITNIKNKNTDYNMLYNIIIKYKDYVASLLFYTRETLNNPSIDLQQLIIWNNLFEVPNQYIIRFLQQRHATNKKHKWQPTVMNSQKWKVEFITNNYGSEYSKSTNINTRSIRYILKNNPKEQDYQYELQDYMTYNSKFHIKRARIK